MTKHTFTIRTRPDDCMQFCEDCVATVEILGDASLYELSESLLDAFGFEHDHAFGFYDNVANIFRSKTAYTVFADMGDGKPGEEGVAETTVADVFPAGKQMILLFDYGDEWTFLVTCEKTEKADDKNAPPKVLSVEGNPPVQYPHWGEDDETEDD